MAGIARRGFLAAMLATSGLAAIGEWFGYKPTADLDPVTDVKTPEQPTSWLYRDIAFRKSQFKERDRLTFSMPKGSRITGLSTNWTFEKDGEYIGFAYACPAIPVGGVQEYEEWTVGYFATKRRPRDGVMLLAALPEPGRPDAALYYRVSPTMADHVEE